MSLIELAGVEGPLVVAFIFALCALPLEVNRRLARNCFWAGCAIFAGLAVMWGITTDYPAGLRMLVVGILSALAGVGAVESARFVMHKEGPLKDSGPASAPFVEGQGGKGGDAKVGGSGIAIGGPGGHAGKYGRGGDGGGGEVQGDGIAAGGEGGSAGDDNVWRPPARSGYEIYMERTGQTPDPFMKQFGRGGAGGGYEPKLQIVEQLRSEYFHSYSKKPESISENINAVPLDYLNGTLAARKESWRVRVVNGQYEFFIPAKPQ